MNKFYLIAFASVLLVVAGCQNKKESGSNATNADSVTKQASVAPKPEAGLSGKAALIAKAWKAAELETPTAKLPGEFLDIKFTFNQDQTFEYSEDGKKQKGKWKLNSEENMLLFEYEDGRKADHDIKELKEDKLVIAGKEHGMYRTLVLVVKS